MRSILAVALVITSHYTALRETLVDVDVMLFLMLRECLLINVVEAALIA